MALGAAEIVGIAVGFQHMCARCVRAFVRFFHSVVSPLRRGRSVLYKHMYIIVGRYVSRVFACAFCILSGLTHSELCAHNSYAAVRESLRTNATRTNNKFVIAQHEHSTQNAQHEHSLHQPVAVDV